MSSARCLADGASDQLMVPGPNRPACASRDSFQASKSSDGMLAGVSETAWPSARTVDGMGGSSTVAWGSSSSTGAGGDKLVVPAPAIAASGDEAASMRGAPQEGQTPSSDPILFDACH